MNIKGFIFKYMYTYIYNIYNNNEEEVLNLRGIGGRLEKLEWGEEVDAIKQSDTSSELG